MTHTYRVINIGGYYRLMRDGALHSTYTTKGAALAGMATEKERDHRRDISYDPEMEHVRGIK